MQSRLALAQQGHPLFTTGNQQSLQIQLLDQRQAFVDQLLLTGTDAHHRLEFGQVGRDQGGPAVDAEILALGVGQHRQIALPSSLDQRLMIDQRTLAIIRKNHYPDLVQQPVHCIQQGLAICSKGLFEVHPQQLLVPTQYSQLGDGRLLGMALESTINTRCIQTPLEYLGGLVLTRDSHQPRRCPQGSNIQRHVTGAAGAVLDLINPDHRHRCLR